MNEQGPGKVATLLGSALLLAGWLAVLGVMLAGIAVVVMLFMGRV